MRKIKKLMSAVVSLMMVCTSMGGFTLWSSADDNETSTVILEKNDKLHFFTEKSADGKTSNHYVVTHENNEIESYEYKKLVISTNGVNENGFVIYGGNHNIILENAEFNNSIMLSKQNGEYATANIEIKGTNKVTAKTRGTVLDTTGKAGISVPEGTTLNLSGTGTLTATGSDDEGILWGDGGAGIGGNDERNAGKINISGNVTVNAQGGFDAAGIGGGDDGNGGNITILGGTVNATGGESGAGIGGGKDSNSGIIYISGGEVTAKGGDYGSGIGGGKYGNGKSINISNGTVTVTGGKCAAGIGGGYDSNSGDIHISGGIVNTIGGDCIEYNTDAKPIGGGAGIGGGHGDNGKNIRISGGTVTATGRNGGAGIGGGDAGGDGGNINISGGTVKATGGDFIEYCQSHSNKSIIGINSVYRGYENDSTDRTASAGGGAGIGGGYDGNGGNIIISGGTVDAQGSFEAAGIGGGYGGNGGDIIISGGTVDTQGGVHGAGIGGGDHGDGGDITIEGATVNAQGGIWAAGIGGGNGNRYGHDGNSGDITIKNAFVRAIGGTNAAGIGGGNGDTYWNGQCENIEIDNSIVIAKGDNSEPIGGCWDKFNSGTVKINGKKLSEETRKENKERGYVQYNEDGSTTEYVNGEIPNKPIRIHIYGPKLDLDTNK